MNVCDLVWDCDVVWDYFGEGKILKEMAHTSTLVTSAALNGLNVTMGYHIRFGFKIKSPELLFMLLLKCKFENVL